MKPRRLHHRAVELHIRQAPFRPHDVDQAHDFQFEGTRPAQGFVLGYPSDPFFPRQPPIFRQCNRRARVLHRPKPIGRYLRCAGQAGQKHQYTYPTHRDAACNTLFHIEWLLFFL